MHVRVRLVGKPEAVVVVESKLTKIEKFRCVLEKKFALAPKLQRLFYGGKLLEDGYTFHDYNIKLNDVIQVIEQMPVKETPKEDKKDAEINEDSIKKDDIKIEYKDAVSELYAVGDFIDMRDREQGAWFEGKIIQIVHDPNAPTNINGSTDTEIEETKNLDIGTTAIGKTEEIFNKDNDLENKPPQVIKGENSNSKIGIAKYFSTTLKKEKKKESSINVNQMKETDEELLYKVQLDGDEEDSNMYCKLSEIRPRARTVINIENLKEGQKVMVNHNTEEPLETGYWYDFKISKIEKRRTIYKLIGTIYLGPQAVPQNDTKVCVREKIFAIEELVPLNQRTDEYIKMMKTPPEKRTLPLNCLTCRDNEDAQCKDCGCYICSGKEFPEKIVLCDECNKGFHMSCLSPPLMDLPEEDWYCPSCKRDPNNVVAPGAAKQIRKASTKGNRDWGRGMACAGKTKTCAMPANHFGPIPGIEVGMCWRFRIQLSESGVHRPPVSGIHGRDVEGAYSIVLSGGYEDDVDKGNEFTYTGSGGRDLSGNKRTAEQSCDQTLTRENKALARNCAVKKISEDGGDAGENWREGKPVRVVRSYKMLKHFPKFAPKEGIRYDGIYKIVKYYPETGLSGYRVWKYLLRRDDSNPAPWEMGAKQFPIIYPDGYLEAEAEKKALKGKTNKRPKDTKKAIKKQALRDSNHTTEIESDSEASPPSKKYKVNGELVKTRKQPKRSKLSSPKNRKTKNQSISQLFNKSPPKTSPQPAKSTVTDKEIKAIKADNLNDKLWEECLEISEKQGRKQFVEHVTQVFLCIICQDVAACPVTTPCLHNFCLGCLKRAFKVTNAQACPHCRNNLSKYEPEENEHLKTALRIILPGYDAGKK